MKSFSCVPICGLTCCRPPYIRNSYYQTLTSCVPICGKMLSLALYEKLLPPACQSAERCCRPPYIRNSESYLLRANLRKDIVAGQTEADGPLGFQTHVRSDDHILDFRRIAGEIIFIKWVGWRNWLGQYDVELPNRFNRLNSHAFL
jgi:hypothetical protein